MDLLHVSAAAMLLLTLVSSTTSSAVNTTAPSLSSMSCEQAMCGGLRIEFPFWISGTHPSECGYRAFQVTCDNGRASLKNSLWTHQILNISYKDSSFRVTNLDLSDSTCNTELNMNTSSNLSLAPFSISTTNQELFFLHNCTALHTQPPPPTWVPLNCDNIITINNSFAWLAGGYKPDDKWSPVPGGCRVSMMPVLGYEGAAGADYWQLMKVGFLLDYVVVGDCTACRESGGLCRINTAYDSFECHCSETVSSSIICGSKRRGKKIMLIGITSAAATFLFACLCVLILHKGRRLWLLHCKKISRNTNKNNEAMIVLYGSLAPKRYMYSEVMKITSSRNNLLGKGGYGMVYKGRLHDGRLVAVKFLHDCKGKGDEFVNEVMSIGRTSHVNVVRLFGFCLKGSKRALIYEYMPNGSLDKYIYSENPKEILGWERLFSIAIGIARGLEYLHYSCNTRIIHFDIKPQNILLDWDFSPKIADFGLAKLCHTKESKLSMTGARGTIGFIAPEVHSRTFGVVSTKSDVYSYGMMLLEMVGGRRNVRSIVAKSSEKYFPDWIYDHFAQDDGLEACEVTNEIEEIARKMILIGLWCIQVIPVHRPTITEVLEMFDRSLDDLEMPPKQNFGELLESSAHNMDVQSASSTRYEETSLVNSRILQQSPTL